MIVDVRRILIEANGYEIPKKAEGTWRTMGGYIEPYDWSFDDVDGTFDDEVRAMAEGGATGFIEIESEYGEFIKYELKDRVVHVNVGSLVWKYDGVL